ncbi:hypothetical protein GGR57DRAFT_502822 [Xylariaceae sp. FL1272]|nr:hypothetical protein GGR57DRAFT_502822 [Xylariaceae sp. FL1272]
MDHNALPAPSSSSPGAFPTRRWLDYAASCQPLNLYGSLLPLVRHGHIDTNSFDGPWYHVGGSPAGFLELLACRGDYNNPLAMAFSDGYAKLSRGIQQYGYSKRVDDYKVLIMTPDYRYPRQYWLASFKKRVYDEVRASCKLDVRGTAGYQKAELYSLGQNEDPEQRASRIRGADLTDLFIETWGVQDCRQNPSCLVAGIDMILDYIWSPGRSDLKDEMKREFYKVMKFLTANIVRRKLGELRLYVHESFEHYEWLIRKMAEWEECPPWTYSHEMFWRS